jgi:hypothetical protein
MMFFEYCLEVLCIIASDVHYSEDVLYQRKCDWLCILHPQAVCVIDRALSVFRDASDEQDGGEEPCLGQSIHSFSYFHIQTAIVKKVI